MTDKERRDYVFGTYLECIKPITNIRKGKTGCEIGKSYWFEYIHDTGDENEWSCFRCPTDSNKTYGKVELAY